jgi:iron(III) transport system substrate-binding protein
VPGKRTIAAALATAALVTMAACGGEGGDTAAGQDESSGTLTVYSGREEEIVEPLFEMFEEETGINVEVRFGDSAELAATIAEEGENSPADVFFAQDPGSLGAVEGAGLLAELPDELLERVDERFRDPDGHWIGTSGRARVVVYNTDKLEEEELPDSILEFADPEWKGRIGLPPTNASFQAFVTVMRLSEGEEATREWLEAIKANDPLLYDSNTPAVEAAARGEIDVGFVNHYYLYIVKAEQTEAPIANHYLRSGDPGAFVSAAGVAVLEGAEHGDEARTFVEFLLSEEGQRFYAEEAAEAEYPLIEGVQPREGLPPLEDLEGPDIPLDELGPELERTLELISEVGLTT